MKYTYKNLTIEFASAPVPVPEAERPFLLRWTATLRSGDFTQCHGTLRNQDGHCCLGVASELQGRLTPVPGEYTDGDLMDAPATLLAISNPLLRVLRPGLDPDADSEGNVSLPAGADALLADAGHNTTYHDNLTSLNDHGATFDEIAFAIDLLWLGIVHPDAVFTP